MAKGKIHLYTGDGKGKTTAAAGLALRAAGFGLTVWFVQFLKGGHSHELAGLEKAGVRVISGQPTDKFSFAMDEEERQATRDFNDQRLAEVRQAAEEGIMDLLILDEAVGAAYGAGLLDVEALLAFVSQKPGSLELVLTGRDPGAQLVALADYHTEMKLLKHPYESEQLGARPGIEY